LPCLHLGALVEPALRAGAVAQHRLAAVLARGHVRRGGLEVRRPALVALLAAGSLLRDSHRFLLLGFRLSAFGSRLSRVSLSSARPSGDRRCPGDARTRARSGRRRTAGKGLCNLPRTQETAAAPARPARAWPERDRSPCR